MGNGRVVKADDLQYISAGSGVLQSEFNPSRKNRVHFLQIWLKPRMSGRAPKYAEKTLGKDAKPNGLTSLFAGEPRDHAVEIRASADVYLGRLDSGKKLLHRPALSRGQWVHVIAGELKVLNESLKAGDVLAIDQAAELEFESGQLSLPACLISNEETKRHAAGSYFRGRIDSIHRPDVKPKQPCNNLLQQSPLNKEKHNQRKNTCPTATNSLRRRTAPSCSLTTNRK